VAKKGATKQDDGLNKDPQNAGVKHDTFYWFNK
jgi:hypothetical protein